MTVAISLYNQADETLIGTFEYAETPAVGSELMVLAREWERWAITQIRYWPKGDVLDAPPSVWAYVAYRGDIED